jgi:arginyl-tRNA synthetase
MLKEAAMPLLENTSMMAPDELSVELDIPKTAQHGDYATNLAMSLTRRLKRNPRDIASGIIENIKDTDGIIERIEIAGPGFLNFFITAGAWHRIIPEILNNPSQYGHPDIGRGRRVQIEFVSANPTGPLHIGHGRGAATGDVLAGILRACGYDVQREYYINDAGNQMDTLGRSLYFRYRQLLGDEVEFPENHYRGEYMIDLARALFEEHGTNFHPEPIGEALPHFTRYAGDRILKGIKDDLADFGVHFDLWFSEQTLHDAQAIRATIEELQSKGHVYEHEGALWFRSSEFGDEKDRVVVRANGISTYFAADLAYHRNKFERGFDTVIDVWGADHHGYQERMLAGIQSMGRSREDLKIVLVQLVNLLRAGTPIAMSTRAGEFVTLREVIDEVGKDAARYIFLTRRTDSPLDFDLEVAKAKSNENPVFYVQYAHARLCSVFEVAEQRGTPFVWNDSIAASGICEPLKLPQEIAIVKLLGEYPAVVANCARTLEPHAITYYLHELVSQFHSYYNKNRIVGETPDLTQARLTLAAAIREVIRSALRLLGVAAPEKM